MYDYGQAIDSQAHFFSFGKADIKIVDKFLSCRLNECDGAVERWGTYKFPGNLSNEEKEKYFAGERNFRIEELDIYELY
jgi:hypothetical protein